MANGLRHDRIKGCLPASGWLARSRHRTDGGGIPSVSESRRRGLLTCRPGGSRGRGFKIPPPRLFFEHRGTIRVTRLGDREVNFYLLEDPGGLVLVDGGLPGHLPQLQSHLEGSGRSLGDIRAVLLTHAHPDHTGAAAAARCGAVLGMASSR